MKLWSRESRGVRAWAVWGLAALLVACGSSGGTSSTGGGDGTGGEGSDGDDSVPMSERPGKFATNITVSEVALFQAVKVTLAKDGAPVDRKNAPIIAGREGLLRVYVTPQDGFESRPLIGELTLYAGDQEVATIRDEKTLAEASRDERLASTFNFEIPGDKLTPDVSFRVVLREKGAGAGADDAGEAQYPLVGEREELKAQRGGEVVRIRLVPIQYAADQSNRVPDTSPAAIERYRAAFYRVFPTAQVEITVREPFPYSQVIDGRNGRSVQQVLQAVVRLRAQDRAPADVYYYGAFTPAPTAAQFCPGGCIAGLSGLVQDPRDTSQRASVGVGYPNFEGTAVHEVAHAMGREHAQCGLPPQDAGDRRFPYPNGGIGVWGYDVVAKSLISPTRGKDFMGYCENTFTSDYTFSALFTRISYVNTNQSSGPASPRAQIIPAQSASRTYRFVSVNEDGTLEWGDTVTLDHELHSEPHDVRFLGARGELLQRAVGHYYPYGDVPGGYMLVPENTTPFHTLRIENLKLERLAKPMTRELVRQF